MIIDLGKSVVIKGELSASEDLTLYGQVKAVSRWPITHSPSVPPPTSGHDLRKGRGDHGRRHGRRDGCRESRDSSHGLGDRWSRVAVPRGRRRRAPSRQSRNAADGLAKPDERCFLAKNAFTRRMTILTLTEHLVL